MAIILMPRGVKVIEFAQSGLKPLIKFARRMGIQWHVLVDGDEAGKKYAATVLGLLNNDRELERDHLTSLPAMDVEHFMYRQDLMTFITGWRRSPDNVPMNMRRVITKAIHRSSSPTWRLRWRWRPADAGWTQCRRC
ncbi:hypothetical protein LNO81_08875 [Klebsiella variicola subsp. variicola]|nr:hypothetical protein [Klebsiella variicola subsp. variicola]